MTDTSIQDDDDMDQLSQSDVSDRVSAPRPSSSAVAGPGPASSANAAARRSNAAASPASSTAGSVAGGGAGGSNPGTPSAGKKRARQSMPRASGTSTYIPPDLPHYTVRKSSSNSKSSPHVISIHAGVSDGSRARWPTAEERTKDRKDPSTGRLSWYETQGRDEGRHRAWRETLGVMMATQLGQMKDTAGGKKQFWILEDLPEEYLHTVHHCTTSSNQARTDVYVFGSPATLKFRTPNEFAPHLYWLLTHGKNDGLRCQCKYCGGVKLQADVNRIVGLPDGRGSSSTPAPGSAIKPKPRQTNVAQPASFKDKGGDKLLGGSGGKKLNKGKEKEKEREVKKEKKRRANEADGVAATSGSGGGGKKPRTSSPDPTYKGAFVSRQRDEDLVDLSAHRHMDLVWAELPTPLLPSDPSQFSPGAAITHWPGILTSRSVRATAEVVDPPDAQDPDSRVKLHTTQEWRYHVRLLGVVDELRDLAADQIRAWLAHPPPTDLWDAEKMANPAAAQHVWDGRRTTRTCDLRRDVPNLEEAITAMALAMQIAAHVVGSMSVQDRYQIEADHLVAVPGAPKPSSTDDRVGKQLRSWGYQSILWGGELIWSGDVVRLMHNSPTAFPPELEDPSPGSLDRSLFLRVESIYKDAESGRLKVAGEVYELRDLQRDPPLKAAEVGGAMSMFETSPGVNGVDGASASSPKPNGAGPAPPPTNGTSAPPPPPNVDPKTGASVPVPASAASIALTRALPPAPHGYAWHGLTAPGSQVHCEVEFLAGRYHVLPKELDRADKINELLEALAVHGRGLSEGEQAPELDWAQRAVVLAGLKPAARLYMKCGEWKSDRSVALIDAEKAAAGEVATYFEDLNSKSSDGSPGPDPNGIAGGSVAATSDGGAVSS
ncbi:hypothetical protein JCM10207_003427 [Rhodosporidiobolus poonsookiae]